MELVQQIHLHLRDLPVVAVHDSAEHVGLVMEGKAGIANLALFHHLVHKTEQIQLKHLLKLVLVQRVSEINVHIFHAQT